MNNVSRCAVITIVITIVFALTFLLVFNVMILDKVYNGCKDYNCSYSIITNHSNCINYSIIFDDQNCYHCLSYQAQNHSKCYTNYVFSQCPIYQSCYGPTLRQVQFIVNSIASVIPILLIFTLIVIIVKNNKIDYHQLN